MIIMSLRVFEKQSPVSRGDCFASSLAIAQDKACNDMQTTSRSVDFTRESQ